MKKSLTTIGAGTIDMEESLNFARLSGDYNPLHLDTVKARRYQFGSTLIHGVNGTLRALELYFAARHNCGVLSSLNVSFLKPVQQGDPLTFVAEHRSPATAHIKVLCLDKEVQSIDLSFILPGENLDETLATFSGVQHNHSYEPAVLALEDVESLEGCAPMAWDAGLFTSLFPVLATKLPSSQCASILTTTYIVGMKCPGLNSIYAGLELTFKTEDCGPVSTLAYRVKDVDSRFSRVVISVSNPTVSGEIVAFFRPTPVTQPSFKVIRSLVRPDHFAGQCALIVGGSRGLGEVIAKILAAGGANTKITFAQGRDDAIRVAEEIIEGGGQCATAKFDVLCNDGVEKLLFEECGVNQIYYMVSPVIQKNDSSFWDSNLFQKYSDYYIRGLADLLTPLTKLREQRNAKLIIYLPSTIFLDRPEKGFSEYIAAKAATESFASQLKTMYPSWRLYTPRLPRMLTDQTSAIMGLETLETVHTILASLPTADT